MRMIPPSYMPQRGSQNIPPDMNNIPQQMQNLKLDQGPYQNSGNQPPTIPSPQHRGHSTTVTYSGPPRATYPYNNNPPAIQKISENNNQYNNFQGQATSNNQELKTHGSMPFPNQQPLIENGMTNGHNLKPQNQTAHIFHQGQHQTVPSSPSSVNSQFMPQSPQFSTPTGPTFSPTGPSSTPNRPTFPPTGPSSTPNRPTFPPTGPSSLQVGQSFPPTGPSSLPVGQSFPPTGSPSSPIGQSFLPTSPSTPYPSSPNHTFSPTNMQPMSAQNPQPPPMGFSPSPTYQPGSPGYSGMPPSPPNSGGMWPNQQFPPAKAPGNYPYPPQPQTVPQQPRLDLDQMPSVVQVREDDKKNRGGYYSTENLDQPPPLVTTDIIVQDRGICSPRFIRSTVYCLPNQPDMLKQTGLPFALTISPMSQLNEEESSPPVALYREQGPLRCKRCKAYICPFMSFMEGGRCFQCAFCKVVTEVPQDYFSFLDGMGERTDKYHRPELCLGSYEFLATKEYCRKDELPNPPAYIFMIEVSNATFRNGLVPLLCENMKHVLQDLKNDEQNDTSKLRVGFVTYNNVLHFYNMKKNLTQPHIMVLSDVHNAFVPLLEGFLVTLSEAEALVDGLMEHIPKLFMNEPLSEVILGPVVQVGLEALKNANCSGKLLIFHSSLPTADAPGKLTHREGQKLLGTDKQKTVLSPQNEFYYKLAQDCVAAGCAVDFFLFPNAYVDVASITPLCRHTGGQMYKYTYFQSHIDGDRFLEDLTRNITMPTAFDAVLRVRTSTGISPVFYYGNFYMSNNTDVELSAVDGHKSVTIELAYDDKLPENEKVYIQAALLYTTITGERRIKVHNLVLPTSVSMPDIFRCCDVDTIINFYAKQALKQVLESPPQQIKSTLIGKAVKSLSCYRKHCASNSTSGQLLLPDSLKLLPLFINCLLKSDAVSGGADMALDDRSFAMLAVNTMDVRNTALHFYPTLIPLHDVDPNSDTIPCPIRCSIEKLNDNGAYLLENNMYMFLWIGQAISPEWLQNVFGVQSANQVDKQKTSLPELDTPLSKKICSIIDELEEGRQWYMRLRVMVQGDKMEAVFRQFLVEDRGLDGSVSYVDFLCHLHREISKNL